MGVNEKLHSCVHLDKLKYKHPAFCVSSQCCHPLHVGGGRRWWALDCCHRVIGHLCVATATTNQEEKDPAPPAAGERGGRGSVNFINGNCDKIFVQ